MDIGGIQERKVIWMALSEFYTDNELNSGDFSEMINVFNDSPFSLDEIKLIDRFEIFPFAWTVLISPVPPIAWNEKYIVEEASKRINKKRFANFISNKIHRHFTGRYSNAIDAMMQSKDK